MSEQVNDFNKLKKEISETTNFDFTDIRTETIVEGLRDWSELNTLTEVKSWFLDQRQSCRMHVTQISLNQVEGWKFSDNGNMTHNSGEFFVVEGVRVSLSEDREVVGGWDQPILTQKGHDGGILGLIRKKIDGIPYYLIEAKAEPGNYEIVQLSPTLQATFSNLKQAHGGRAPRYSEYFWNGTDVHCQGRILFKQWLSEDGGRLFNKRNLGVLVEISAEINIELPSNFIWLSLYQIKQLLKENAWVNPHVRGIIAHL